MYVVEKKPEINTTLVHSTKPIILLLCFRSLAAFYALTTYVNALDVAAPFVFSSARAHDVFFPSVELLFPVKMAAAAYIYI